MRFVKKLPEIFCLIFLQNMISFHFATKDTEPFKGKFPVKSQFNQFLQIKCGFETIFFMKLDEGSPNAPFNPSVDTLPSQVTSGSRIWGWRSRFRKGRRYGGESARWATWVSVGQGGRRFLLLLSPHPFLF